jgi:gas vesicle protein
MNDEQQKVLSAWDVMKEMQRMMNEHVKLTLNQYREVLEFYGTPTKMLKDAVAQYWPKGSEALFENIDRWFDEQMKTVMKNLENATVESTRRMPGEDMQMLGSKEMQKIFGDPSGLWKSNYKKFKESREQMDKAALDFAKSMLPANLHPMLEKTSQWYKEQADKMEDEIMKNMENQKQPEIKAITKKKKK